MGKKKMKNIPKFKNEDVERKFWSEHDASEYIGWSQAQVVKFPNLKPTTRSISIRLPEMMLNDLKVLANKQDVPYQSLIKVFLSERIQKELKTR